MSTATRRHRRGRNDNPETSAGDTVTLTSPEFISKLRREYVDNTTQAQTARAEAERGFRDASRFEQQVADLGAKEQAAVARIQQAQAELNQVQAERKEAASFAEQARTYGTSQTANREQFEQQASDALTVLTSFGLDVPEVPEPAHQGSNGTDPAGPTRTDLAGGDPLTDDVTPFPGAQDQEIKDSVDRLIQHHETDPAGEAGAA